MSNKNNDILSKADNINDFIKNKIKEENSDDYNYEYKYKVVVLGCAGATLEVDSVKKIPTPEAKKAIPPRIKCQKKQKKYYLLIFLLKGK